MVDYQRWLAMPPVELAAVILPFARRKIVKWLTTGSDRVGVIAYHRKDAFEKPDVHAVAEALQVLERACLLMRSCGEVTYIGLTRLGQYALATNAVRQHLGISDATTTA